MTIGLILLAVAAIFMFFGGAERFFSKIGLPGWAAFLMVLALVAGAVIPQIRFSNAFSINLGGFLIPLAVMAVFFFLCAGKDNKIKALLSIVAVTAVCVAVRMLIPMSSVGLTVTVSVVIGFVGAAVSCIISQSRLPALIGVLGGIVTGDVIALLIDRFLINGSFVALGSSGVFDAIIIGVVIALIIAEALAAIKKHSVSRRKITQAEAAEDVTASSIIDGADGSLSENIEAAQDFADTQSVQPPVFHFNEEDYEEYFNDDID